jgi:predicted AlkP superfamily pyrophosphatase or phosphodiesterase
MLELGELMLDLRLLAFGLFTTIVPLAAHAAPLLLISIDGLRPADVIDAEKRGLKIPTLRKFVTEGSYADSVIGVFPTVTYPSHATLLTGVEPAAHGIVGNTTFDPLGVNQGGWYWFASDFKVPTLWDGARAAGMTVANVHWPVSVGAKSITYNLPQIWRTGHGDDAKLVEALSTPGLLTSLESKLGAYAPGIDESIAGDATRGRFAAQLIADKKPGFSTVYFTALDHEQHSEGPGSAKAHAVLERIDAIIAALIKSQMAAHPDSVIALVSDHGFSATDTEVNLFRAFIDEGLIRLDSAGKIKDWSATPWNSGGSSAIILARPNDKMLFAKVQALLTKLEADPANRIADILDVATTKARGGNPAASFYVNFERNAYAGNFKGKDVALVGASANKGTHGYSPEALEMRSTFMLWGAKIPRGKRYGEIDIRSIAPTLAQIMGFKLASSKHQPLK